MYLHPLQSGFQERTEDLFNNLKPSNNVLGEHNFKSIETPARKSYIPSWRIPTIRNFLTEAERLSDRRDELKTAKKRLEETHGGMQHPTSRRTKQWKEVTILSNQFNECTAKDKKLCDKKCNQNSHQASSQKVRNNVLRLEIYTRYQRKIAHLLSQLTK